MLLNWEYNHLSSAQKWKPTFGLVIADPGDQTRNLLEHCIVLFFLGRSLHILWSPESSWQETTEDVLGHEEFIARWHASDNSCRYRTCGSSATDEIIQMQAKSLRQVSEWALVGWLRAMRLQAETPCWWKQSEETGQTVGAIREPLLTQVITLYNCGEQKSVSERNTYQILR